MKARFGAFRIDTAIPELTRDGVAVAVEPKVLDILIYLFENRDRIVSKDELIETVWRGRIVSDAAITSRINLVRHAVGDSGREQNTIQTQPKRGFRFVAAVEQETGAAQDPDERTVAEPLAAEASILVLPFTDLSPGSSEFLAEGLTEDLIVALSRYSDVRVVSISSAQRLKDRRSLLENPMANVPTDYLVTGTVQVRGQRVRITVQLSERSSGASICAEQFDRQIENYFDLQDDIVRSLAGYLPWRVFDDVGRRLNRSNSPRLSSYQALLRAEYDMAAHQDILREEADYRRIVANDPGFGPARAALAFLLGYKVFITGQQTESEVEESLDQARAAIRLAPDNERVLSKCAMVFQFGGQYPVAKKLAEQAITINPNSTECTHFLATILAASGEAERAMSYHQRTMDLDPLFPEGHYEGMIEALYVMHRHKEALELVAKWTNPHPHCQAYAAALWAKEGNDVRARMCTERFEAAKPDGYSNATFVAALLRCYTRPEDREHWLTGFVAAGISGINGS